MEQPVIHAVFDEATNTVSYFDWDAAAKDAAVIDPVLDWDNRSGEAATTSADALIDAAAEAGVTIRWVLETYAHAKLPVKAKAGRATVFAEGAAR